MRDPEVYSPLTASEFLCLEFIPPSWLPAFSPPESHADYLVSYFSPSLTGLWRHHEGLIVLWLFPAHSVRVQGACQSWWTETEHNGFIKNRQRLLALGRMISEISRGYELNETRGGSPSLKAFSTPLPLSLQFSKYVNWNSFNFLFNFPLDPSWSCSEMMGRLNFK